MFKNEPLTDFSLEENRQNMISALKCLDETIQGGGLRAKPIIGGTESGTEEVYKSLDPADPNVCIGEVQFGNINVVNTALKVVQEGARKWGKVPVAKRAEIIRKAADLAQARRFELNALIIREAGKPWIEADADVAEGIDFCRYYADEMERMGVIKKLGNVPGEKNLYFYKPRGLGVVIAPWNFPFAISCGMVVAGLVTGNGVVYKPSEQTSLVGKMLADILLEAGVEPSAFAFIPGQGELVGDALVKSHMVDYICFTGSKEVGLSILKEASIRREGQRNIKKVILEMGGKNACIVDSDADMDEAIKGVLVSAYGFAGQKCSACSRLILLKDVYDEFMSRFIPAMKDLIVGPPAEPATEVPPLIDEQAYSTTLERIDRINRDYTVFSHDNIPDKGYFVPPMVVEGVKQGDWVWREELFAPILAVVSAKNFDEALALANDSEYALTGGVYSRNIEHIKKAIDEFDVGNLYINRKQTGALVYRQPFGGFRMSGIGSKAGGPDYLIQFVEPKTVCENTARKGYSPDLG